MIYCTVVKVLRLSDLVRLYSLPKRVVRLTESIYHLVIVSCILDILYSVYYQVILSWSKTSYYPQFNTHTKEHRWMVIYQNIRIFRTFSLKNSLSVQRHFWPCFFLLKKKRNNQRIVNIASRADLVFVFYCKNRCIIVRFIHIRLYRRIKETFLFK